MGVALAMGGALGIDVALISEVLPEVEPLAMSAMMERLKDG